MCSCVLFRRVAIVYAGNIHKQAMLLFWHLPYDAQDNTPPPWTNFKTDFLDDGESAHVERRAKGKKEILDGVFANAAILVVCAPLVLEKTGSEIRPMGCVVSSVM